MDSELYLGFDGGATKTQLVAMNSRREIVAEGTGKATNFQVIGVKQASLNIFELTESLLEKIGSDFSGIKAMYLALAGAGRKDDARTMLGGFVNLLDTKRYPIPKIQVEGDGTAALEGAFGGKPGMILVSGTGSILFAKDETNRVYRTGGWGRLIGDEGSGYVIGRACLAAVARESDGRGKGTIMTRLLCEKLKIENPESMIREVYQDGFDIASAATVVLDAAEKGDEVAASIITTNVDDLVLHVSAILKKMNRPVPLALSGSLLSNDNIFLRSFQDRIKGTFPQVEILKPQFSPAFGAALLACKMAQI